MAFSLDVPQKLAKAGWKVKIRDKERLEEPHLTILKGTKAWRVGLRSGSFLDGGRWKDFPGELKECIDENWADLCEAWDEMYPHNPVPAEDDAVEEDENG